MTLGNMHQWVRSWDKDQKEANKGTISRVTTVGSWNSVPLGTSGKWCGTHTSEFILQRNEEAGEFIHIFLLVFGWESGRGRALSYWHLWSVYHVHLGKTDCIWPRDTGNGRWQLDLHAPKCFSFRTVRVQHQPNWVWISILPFTSGVTLVNSFILSEPQVLHL